MTTFDKQKQNEGKGKKIHQHLFLKYFEGLEEREDDIFHLGIKTKESCWVIKYKCNCGKEQEFVNSEGERPEMPESFRIK